MSYISPICCWTRCCSRDKRRGEDVRINKFSQLLSTEMFISFVRVVFFKLYKITEGVSGPSTYREIRWVMLSETFIDDALVTYPCGILMYRSQHLTYPAPTLSPLPKGWNSSGSGKIDRLRTVQGVQKWKNPLSGNVICFRLLHMICYPDSASHTSPDLDQKTMITRLLEVSHTGAPRVHKMSFK